MSSWSLCNCVRWAGKNKLKIVSTGLLTASGVYIAYNYLKDIQQARIEEYEKAELKEEFFKKILFKETLIPEMSKLISQFEATMALPSKEEIAVQARGENKLKFWGDFVLLNFTRIILITYAISIFIISVRIHLVLVGRYVYLSTQLPSPSLNQMGDRSRLFLESCEYFVHTGLQHLRNTVERSSLPILSKRSLSSKCTSDDVKEIINEIRKEIQYAKEGNIENLQSPLTQYLMEPETVHNSETNVDPNIVYLQNEIRDIFEREDLKQCIDWITEKAFGIVLTKILQEIAKSDNLVPLVKLPTLLTNVTTDIENELPNIIDTLCNSPQLEQLEWRIFHVTSKS